MSEPNRILEARTKVAERLVVLNDEALHRLMAATSIDPTIVNIYRRHRLAAFHSGILNADECLTICQALSDYGFKGDVELALRVTIAEVMAILMRGVRYQP